MLRAASILLGLLLALAMPGAARATPGITIAPTAVPPDVSLVTLSGRGFDAYAGTVLSYVITDAAGQAVGAGPVTIDAAGAFSRIPVATEHLRPGWYKVSVVRNDAAGRPTAAVLASAPLAILALAVTPATGGPGTIFVVTGGYFIGDTPATLAVTGASAQRGEPPLLTQSFTVGPGGDFQIPLDSARLGVGQYRVNVIQENTALTTTTFTIGDSGLPGLPNTGGGARAARNGSVPSLSPGRSLVAIAAVAIAVTWWHRRSTTETAQNQRGPTTYTTRP